MESADLQSLCDLGQRQLMQMQYLEAEATLSHAEERAWAARDFDTLSRLYMPLQEARRQRRQRCGEGTMRLDLIAPGPDEQPDPERIISRTPHGQLLIAGWGTVAPSARFRELRRDRKLYVETFLAAAFPITGGRRAVVLVPLKELALPAPREQTIDALLGRLPPHCIVMHEDELPEGPRPCTYETYARTMDLWERLHTPYLAAADMQVDPVQRIAHYRRAIDVDYACELAHQKLSDVARDLARRARAGA